MTMRATCAIAVRRAGPDDAEAVASLHGASFANGWDSASMAVFLGSPSCLCLVGALSAEAPEQGFVLARTAGDEAELITIAVDPGCRRRGVAQALLKEAMRVLREAGTAKLFLEVDEGNVAAQNLYASLGAVAVGRRKAYYESGADALIFCLAL